MPYQTVRMNHNWPGGVLITPEFRREVAEFASKTTAENASRQYHVSAVNICKWMRHFGLPVRRACSPTKAEVLSWC